MSDKQRSDLLGGLKKLEEVRKYVADSRLSKKFPDQPNYGSPFSVDMSRVERELDDALRLFYSGLQNIYPDLARSIDGDVPVWEETKPIENLFSWIQDRLVRQKTVVVHYGSYWLDKQERDKIMRVAREDGMDVTWRKVEDSWVARFSLLSKRDAREDGPRKP